MPKTVQQSTSYRNLSFDLHLDETLLIFNHSNAPYIDLKKELPDLNTKVQIQGDEPPEE